ncbi:MAG: filamentous hemagglutinin N-terminal domain-containing protein, partial [Rhizobiaceae bacterium]|nr:filamentous hemagglutinin N-terminal domain-containing protein [Rhizobiaceae bacterium]
MMNSHSPALSVLLASTALSSFALAVTPAEAGGPVLPTGGQVAAGNVSVGPASGNQLTIKQSSSSAVVNWQDFSIGKGGSVNIVQPSSTAALLNRVTGGTTSTISGTINANGEVYLVNPNGISISKSGTVKAGGGFVASTLGISDQDFMDGKRTFAGKGASAAVDNAGTISIGRGGYTALLGGQVSNSGTISVPLGTVGLGAGEQAALDLSGDGFLQVAIPSAVDGKNTGKAGGKQALIEQSGRISASGGRVEIKAAAARDMARQAINMSGLTEANSVSGINGSIVLGGDDGAVAISGKLEATSKSGRGGSVTVTGRTIALQSAKVDVSGKTGGGTVKIGGDNQGRGSLAHAESVSMDAASSIRADATTDGRGGDVVLWSDGQTIANGTISATGGAQGGDGGGIETSGLQVDFTGIDVNASAAHGSAGTWLVDPVNLTVDAAAAQTIDSTLSAGTSVTLQTTSSGASGTGTQSSGLGDIDIESALSWGSAATLTLDAYHSIAIDAPITISGAGGLSLLTNDNGGDGTGTLTSGGGVQYTGTAHSGQSLTINGIGYTLLYSMAELDAIDGTSAVDGSSVLGSSSGLSGNYALAKSLDASGTTYTDAVIAPDSSGSFTGMLEGLGNTISGLTINSGDQYVGLIGQLNGRVRDIGLIGGSILSWNYDQAYAGELVGSQIAGDISQSYATGTVSSNNVVGELVGEQGGGSISRSYATAAVRGDLAGGLVGEQDAGSIAQSYATGASFGYSESGGLVGYQTAGSISQSHATGTVNSN